MTDGQVCLTLIVPRTLHLVPGFTATDAAGHGPEVRLHTAAERVKGHADQVVVQVILPTSDAERLIEQLRIPFAGTRLVYWILPVTDFCIIE